MLGYDKIDISEGIDINKTNLSKECDICHYLYFKDIGFKYEPYIKENACRIHFWYINKDDAINIMNGSNLVHKRGVL